MRRSFYLVCFLALFWGERPSSKGMAEETETQAEKVAWTATRSEKLTLTSQAINSIALQDRPRGVHALDWNVDRIQWNEEFSAHPDRQFGNHTCSVGRTASDTTGKRPFSLVGAYLDLFPDAKPVVNTRLITGRLVAKYHGASAFESEKIGLFGATFKTDLADDRLKRVPSAPRDSQRSFFSFPIDLAADGTIEDVFGKPSPQIKRPWGACEILDGTFWLLYCRKNGDQVVIRQCKMKETWLKFSRESPVETIERQVGERHTVGDFSFLITEIEMSGQYGPFSWFHIADPVMK